MKLRILKLFNLQHFQYFLSTCPSNPQVHAATGRYTECLSMRLISDCTGHNVFCCFFYGYGRV